MQTSRNHELCRSRTGNIGSQKKMRKFDPRIQGGVAAESIVDNAKPYNEDLKTVTISSFFKARSPKLGMHDFCILRWDETSGQKNAEFQCSDKSERRTW